MKNKSIPTFSKFKSCFVLYLKNNKPVNSKYANYFHDELLKNTGIEVIASDVVLIHPHVSIHLWIQDNEISEKFMAGRRYYWLDSIDNKQIKDNIFSCLASVAKKYGFKLPDEAPSLQKVVVKDGGVYVPTPLTITVNSLPLTRKSDILHASISPITKMFKEQYPQYNVICLVGTEKWDTSDDAHMFLFLKFREIDTAMSNGDLERMREEAYKILQTYDTDHLITQEDYTPFIKSRDRYSSMDLRSLFDINDGVF